MKITRPVIVLGAGASYAAKFSDQKKTPPLDSNFLLHASRIFSQIRARGKNKVRAAAWNSFRKHLKQARLDFEEIKAWRLEQLSIFLEARANLQGLQLDAGHPRDFKRALDALKVMVGNVLLASGGDKACDLHRMLFSSVKPMGTVSFNYDLIADQTMLQMGLLNWTKADYRNAKTAHVPRGKRYFSVRVINTARLDGCIPLIKLHGSIHWEQLARGTGYRISGCNLPTSSNTPFRLISIPKRPYLIPPVAAKFEIKEGALREHWYKAVDLLHRAGSWIIWGYSFPKTDTIAQVLFRSALTRNKKAKRVIVINPDAEVAQRIEDVCKKVSVTSFSSIEQFLLENRTLIERKDNLS